MGETPTQKLNKAIERTVKHESTYLFTRGLIALGVAYLCWASNLLFAKFDNASEEHGTAIGALRLQVERIGITLVGADKNIQEIEAMQHKLQDKLETHINRPAHHGMEIKAARMAEDINEIKSQMLRK